MQKGRVLIISHSDPFGIGGGSFACHAYVKAFSECFDGAADICVPAESQYEVDESIKYNRILRVPKRSIFSRILSFFTGRIDRYSGFVIKIIRDNHDVYSTVVLNGCRESGSMVRELKYSGINVITVFHNYERDYFRDNCRIPFFRSVMLHHIRTLEKKAYKYSDINLFLTQRDMDMYEKTYGANKNNRLTGVFEYKDITKSERQDRNVSNLTFIITGLLNNKQGEDSIVYFFNQLYRLLPSGSKVLIAGFNPTGKVTGLCKRYDNVTLVPNPSDMCEVMAQGDVYLCPANTGSGVKLRIMDGLKAGLPVITHEYSSHGFESLISKPYIKSFSTVQGFKDAVKDVSEGIRSGQYNTSVIWNDYYSHFSYDTGLDKVRIILKEFNKMSYLV